MLNGYSTLVSEGIIVAEERGYRAAVPLPAEACVCWADNEGGVASGRSKWRFGVSLVGHFIESLKKLRSLVNAKPREFSGDYTVTVNFSPAVWASAKVNQESGFLPWIVSASPLSGKFDTLVFQQGAEGFVDNEGPLMLGAVNAITANSLFPALSSPIKRASFVLSALALVSWSLLLALVGKWQGVVLLPDLIELSYFRRLSVQERAKAYIFTLGDQMNRPLWTWEAEKFGSEVHFVYFASSYSMFHYHRKEVSMKQRHPVVVGNCWTSCWVQTVQVRDCLQKIFNHTPVVSVVGAFDMVDDASPMPELPTRSVLVFDVEPNGQLLRLSEQGYLCPFLTEEVLIDFWRELGRVAKELSLVLMHKPKRPNPFFREKAYANLIAQLREDGLYHELPTGIGPARALKRAGIAVILPFTSVGDIAVEMKISAAFFDAREGILDPDDHANGLPVICGAESLKDWLSNFFLEKQ